LYDCTKQAKLFQAARTDLPCQPAMPTVPLLFICNDGDRWACFATFWRTNRFVLNVH